MSDILSIEWDHSYVSGVVADVAPGRVSIRRTFIIQRPNTSGSASGTLQLDWLKPELDRLGITPGPALVALPRDEAVVKRLELPQVSDEELPTIVKFQAVAKSSVGIDDLSLDFIPLVRQGEIPGREVLVATIPRQSLDEVKTVCQAAGIEAKVIGLTAVAMAQFVARAEQNVDAASTGASLVVARHGKRIEISVLRKSHLLFSHSSRLSDGATGQEAQAITAEVSRALVALRGAAADVKIDRIWTMVSPAEQELLVESLHRRLNCEVRPLDPFESVEAAAGVASQTADRAIFAGPIGMLLAQYDSKAPTIDFLSPRRPPVKRNEKRRQLIFAGAGVATLIAVLVSLQWRRLAQLDSEIADLNATDSQLNSDLALLEPTKAAAKQIADWNADRIEWIDELTALTQRIPSTERIYLQSIDCQPRNGTVAPSFEVRGFARESDDIFELNTRFAADDHFKGIPVKPEGAAPKEVEYYTMKFSKLLRLLPAPAKKPVKAAAAGAADAKAAGEQPGRATTTESASGEKASS